jgi:hypothetical protein
MLGHHAGLLAAYLVAVAAWLIAARWMRWLRPQTPPPRFEHPWRQVLHAVVAVVGVLLVGAVYSKGWLLPSGARSHPFLDAIDQVLIYSPMLLLVWRQGTETAWLPRDRVPQRISAGAAVAQVALMAYALARGTSWQALVMRVYAVGNFSWLVQVLLEDISIAALFVRLSAAISSRLALIVVAVLFAAAHIPGMLSAGATASSLLPLVIDALLGVLVLSVLQRSRDVWCFWMVHFALDMTQF